MTAQEIAALIWDIKESIRGLYDDSEVEDVILPFTLLRRMDCVLDPCREAIMKTLEGIDNDRIREVKLKSQMRRHHLSFFNKSGLSLVRLLAQPDSIADNFKLYLEGFTDNVRDIFSNFVHQDTNSAYVDLSPIYDRLARNNKLFAVTQKFAQVPLHPDEVDNAMMGTVFEIVVRYSKEAANTKAGQFYTPRDVVRLLVALACCGAEESLAESGRIVSLYDPCCGTGGMLTDGKEYLRQATGRQASVINLFGQELNEKTYAICKADMLLKGELRDGVEDQIALGNTLTDDRMFGRTFDLMLANPPFGMDWADEYERVARENCVGGRFEAGLPDKSDGSLLFLQHMVSKMDPSRGSRIGIVLNGSPLFNGGAGSGWSGIRKMLLDRNLLDAIVALPKNLFYGTDIATYLWILDNQRPETRRRKVLFINASYPEFIEPLKRSLGKKRFAMTPAASEDLVAIYRAYQPCRRNVADPDTGELRSVEIAKLIDYADFLYTRVTVNRPLRLVFQNLAERYAQLCHSDKFKADDPKNAILKTIGDLDGADTRRTDAEFFSWLKKCGVKASTAAVVKKVRLLATVDEQAPPVHEKPLDPQSPVVMDPDLADAENIPFAIPVETYLQQEVLPFAPDAVADRSKDKVGCDFPFTRLFYEYKPLRPVEDIVADLMALEQDTEQDLHAWIKSL